MHQKNIVSEQADNKLFLTFREYGTKALLYRQKCIGLLPGIYRRKIHEQQGFPSIFEFAARYAGLSQEQVKRVLSLDEKFQDKPALKVALESGEVSINKLARVVSIATVENQEELAEQARLLSKNALETLVRDEKRLRAITHDTLQNDSISVKPEFVPGHKSFGAVEDVDKLIGIMAEKSLKLAPEVVVKLRGLKEKGIDINRLILETLDKRNAEIEREKEQIGLHMTDETGTRYIPVRVRRVLHAEHGSCCSIPGCGKPSEATHHTRRFALNHRHDPRFMAPLCRNHHQIAHTIDVNVNRERKKYLKGYEHFINKMFTFTKS